MRVSDGDPTGKPGTTHSFPELERPTSGVNPLMSRRLLVFVVSLSLTTAAFQGCGGGELKEGMPDDIDMTKDYSPEAAAGPFDFRQMQKDAAKKPAGQ